MNTPVNKSKLRIGLSRTTGSIKKRSTILTPLSAPSDSSSTSTATPLTVPKTTTTNTPKTTLKKNVFLKKKLVFAARKHYESSEEETETADYESLDLESLKALVDKKKLKLEQLEKHQREKENLTILIEQWKQAGLDGLEKLREIHNEPQASIGKILDSFNIPQEMYLD